MSYRDQPTGEQPRGGSAPSYFHESFFGLILHNLSKGKLFRYSEQADDFTPAERYMPGYKTRLQQEKSSQPASSQLVKRDSESANSTVAASPVIGANARDTSSDTIEAPPKDGDDTDPYLVDWDGELDPDNPRNWSQPKKVFAAFLICLLTTTVYMASAIFTSAIPLFAQYFGIGTVTATLGLSLFVIGYSLGPPLGLSAMSEIPAIGRSIPYVLTLAVYVILQVPTALVNNVAGFMILRFLAGAAGSPSLATGGATMNDLYSPRVSSLAIAAWGISAVCGPSLGPLIGGYATQGFEPRIGLEAWRWTIWPLLFLGGFTLIVLLLFLPETSASNILHRRANRLRAATGNPHLRTKGELFSESLSGKEIAMMTLVRPLTLGLGEAIVLAINLHIGLVYGILYLWLEAFPIVFIEVHGFTSGQLGLAFLGILVAALLAYVLFAIWHKYRYEPLYARQNGVVLPEIWMEIGMVGAPCIPICMFLFGWGSTASIHWIVPIIASGFFAIGTFGLFQSGLSYLSNSYPEYIASVLAANDFFRGMVGGALPLVARAMFGNLQANGPAAFPVAWGSTLIGCIAVVMTPIPFVLYKYGPKLRERSPYCVRFPGENEAREAQQKQQENESDKAQ